MRYARTVDHTLQGFEKSMNDLWEMSKTDPAAKDALDSVLSHASLRLEEVARKARNSFFREESRHLITHTKYIGFPARSEPVKDGSRSRNVP